MVALGVGQRNPAAPRQLTAPPKDAESDARRVR